MRRPVSLPFIGILLIAAILTISPAYAADTRPNIMIIMADDMGYSDIGCYGGEVETPNLDGLAANGLRFRQFYNAARCCPTRASLLTGLYPHQAGVGRMVSRPYGDNPKTYKPGPYQGFLNEQCVTLAEALKPAGYSTYMSGKWHVGEAEEHWPLKRGFDRYFGLISGASSYYELVNPDRRMALDNRRWEPPGEGFYMTDAFVDHAVKCLEEHDTSAPFFHYVAFTAPHWPLHAHPEDIATYADRYLGGWDELRKERHARMIEMGIVDEKWPLSPRDENVPAWEDRPDDVDWALRMAVYAAMIDRMDQGIGRILDVLKTRDMLDNTLILFLSDNGGCHEAIDKRKLNQPGTKPGERGSYVAYRRPWANASNTPFRMFKHWIHEGGASTPLIAHWPAGIKAKGDLTNAVGHIIDFMPTCLELADAKYPESFNGKAITPMEGQSLVPILTGESEGEPRTLYWEHYGNAGIRDGDWKLVTLSENRKNVVWELYNIAEDRTELIDLMEEQPDRAQNLLEKWEAWAERLGVHDRP